MNLPGTLRFATRAATGEDVLHLLEMLNAGGDVYRCWMAARSGMKRPDS